MAETPPPSLSILVCSHNPREAFFRRVLAALQGQTLPQDQWQLIIIDSASDLPLAKRFDLTWHPQATCLREEQPGKTRALMRGMALAQAPVLILVDDDNVLAADYLERALEIARTHPKLGAWGGNVVLEFDTPPEEWTRRYWPFLAEQRAGVDALVCNMELSYPLPAGAGCCVRKEVADHYIAQIAKSPWRLALGRTGKSLMAGEDSDLVLTACELGLDRGLFRALSLQHLIPPERLREEYLIRLVEGIQFSSYVLEMCRDHRKAPPKVNWWWYVKLFADCLTRYGRKRQFYLANKRAQRRAWQVYRSLKVEG